VDLVVVSTNEVFDGQRTDGRGYAVGDEVAPPNPYGASKLAGERAAEAAFGQAGLAWGSGGGRSSGSGDGRSSRRGGGPQLAIVRTAWLFGPPGNDFPSKILAAARRAAAAGEPLRVVGDEVGSPTYTADLAEAIVELLGAGEFGGLHHVVNSGAVSRAGWARELFRRAGVAVGIEEVPAATWERASTPPAWAVLEPTPLPSGEPLRPWQEALADYLPLLRRRGA
jgi:dTDP-4-dehydrorhamnose reductase